jgi:hypothetical protein
MKKKGINYPRICTQRRYGDGRTEPGTSLTKQQRVLSGTRFCMDPCRVRSESSGNEQRRPSEQSEWFQHKPVAELWARATDRHERRRFKLQGRWRAPTHCSHRAVPSSLEQARKALAKSWEQTSSSWRYALGSARSPVLRCFSPVLRWAGDYECTTLFRIPFCSQCRCPIAQPSAKTGPSMAQHPASTSPFDGTRDGTVAAV